MRKTFSALSLLASLASAALIQNLPGQPPAAFKQYSGYYPAQNGNHMIHYWFMESQNNPSTDPLLLWLTGGPGCSGVSAILEEWGPFQVNPDGATLYFNKYGWNRNASVLTIESPAGVGYSYAKNGSINTDDDQTAYESWEALRGFFTEFPQYRKNDFYITGESYGGIYVPTLASTILQRQSDFSINLKGYAIGNGLLDDELDVDGLASFLHKHGMIDEAQWRKVQAQCCSNDTDDCPFGTFTKLGFCHLFAEEVVNRAWRGGLNPYNMYSDCETAQAAELRKAHFQAVYSRAVKPHELSTPICVNVSAVTVYLNRRDVRTALGIPGLLPEWSICSTQVGQSYKRIYATMKPQISAALAANLRVLLYYGDIDMACNFLGGQKFAHQLGVPLVAAKQPYHLNGQVAGYVTDYGAMKFLTVKGAGHLVPADKPAVAYYILDTFLNNGKF